MSCQIFRNGKTREIEKVLAPNGNISNLYDSLLLRSNLNKELALQRWLYSYTDHYRVNHLMLDENNESVFSEDLIVNFSPPALGEERNRDLYPEIKNKNFDAILDVLDEEARTPLEKWTIKAIKRRAKELEDINLPTLVTFSNEKKIAYVKYYPNYSELVVGSRNKEVDWETMTHEALHVVLFASIEAINRGKFSDKTSVEAVKNLEELRLRLLTELQNKVDLNEVEKVILKNTNTLKDVHEIISWGLSNTTFQEYLKSKPYGKQKTFWDRFIDLILEVLGLNPSTKERAFFTELISNAAYLLENTPISNYYKSRQSNIEYSSEPLVEESKKLIKDENNKYTSKSGVTYDSVTNGVIPNFKNIKFDNTSTRGIVDAEKLWKDIPKDVKQKTWITDTPISYQEHANAVDEYYSRFMARAEIYHLTFHWYFSRSESAAYAKSLLMETHGITSGEVDWLLDTNKYGKENLRVILENRTGTDYWSENARDKIVTELQIKSDLLGWAGRVDMVIDHGDNILSVFDIKTGYGINREFQRYLLEYGDTYGKVVWDNPLNEAKLQIMLYAVMMKSENPNLRFRNLKVLHIPSEFDKNYDSIHNIVDVAAFLEIIEAYLKDKEPAKHKALLAKNPKIFEPDEYQVASQYSFKTGLSEKADPAMDLKLKIQELESLIMYDQNIVKGVKSAKKGAGERKQRIKVLMEDIIKLQKDSSLSYASWDRDLSWFDNWIGSASYSHNPYVQMYYRLLSEQKQKSRKDYMTWKEKFNKLLENVLRVNGEQKVTRWVGGVNREKVFEKFYITETYGETVKRRLVTNKPIDEQRYSQLGAEEKAFIDFVNDSIEKFFVDEKSEFIDPATGKQTALANKIVTYKKSKGHEVPVTNLMLFNKELKRSGRREQGKKWEYYYGFLPKYAPQLDDIAKQHGGYLSKGMLQYLWNKHVTNFWEYEFDGWGNTQEGIPLKGLGNQFIDNNGYYTLNLELAVDTFIKNMYYKQHMDEVYTFGLGLQMYLKELTRAEETLSLNRLTEWFEDSVQQHILGRKDLTNDWLTRNFKINTAKGYQQFNFPKFLRTLRNFFSSATMWLKPVTGIANHIFATIVTLKEGFKNSVLSSADFGLKEITAGFGVAWKMQTDSIAGNLRKNKAYILMEKFGYLPDSYDWYTETNELLTTRNKLFSNRFMTGFHTIPEEVVATAIFVAQLKAMKTPDGKSVWDHYEEKTITLSSGETYTTYEWDGTKRGKVNTSTIVENPVYEDLEELSINEINKIKFLYEKIHGSYRGDERVRAEYYVLGELLLQFKKYLPGTLKNIVGSRGYRYTQGTYEKATDAEGNEYLKWTPQVAEGRWRLLVGNLTSLVSSRIAGTPEEDNNSKLATWAGMHAMHSYRWENLSDVQKQDLVDTYITLAMMLLLFIGYNMAWDRDEEDSLKKIYARIMNDITLPVSPVEMIHNVTGLSRPVTLSKLDKSLVSGSETLASLWWVALGNEERAYTQQGNLRGFKTLQSQVPILSAYHDVVKFLTESDDLQESLDYRFK